jgi:hypothetical protein
MATAKLKRKPRLSKIESYIAANSNSKEVHRERSGLTTTCGCLFGFVYKKKPTYLERFIREESSQRAPPFFVDGGSIN